MAPIAGRRRWYRRGCAGAIAQLGERVVRNDEVGGSIPPGSTTLRRSPKGEDGLMWYVYIIRSIDFPDREYIGATANLKQRITRS